MCLNAVRTRRYLSACLVTAAVMLFAGEVFAESADELNEQALAAFEQHRFVEAAQLFARAYRGDPDPTFRKSEAIAWFKADRCDEAINAANAFLHEVKDGRDTSEAQAVVANCKTTMAESAIDARSFALAEKLLFEADQIAPDGFTRDRITATRVTLANARTAARAGNEPAPEPIAPPPVVQARPSAAPGWVAIGAGASAVIAGAIWHTVTLTSTVPRLKTEANGGDPDVHQRLSRQVSTARSMVWVLYGLGAAGIGIGGWYVISKSGEQSGDEVGISWSARF